MNFKAYAFISYQTKDKICAGKIKQLLSTIGIDSFLAHEDIHVSDEWKQKILIEISRAEIFIPLLSKNYFSSAYCVQESGIAAFRESITIIPLSIDGSIPQGLFSHIQSTKIDPDSISIQNILPGLVKYDFSKGVDLLIEIFRNSKSEEEATSNYLLLLPYILRMDNQKIKEIFKIFLTNTKVFHSDSLINKYLPALFRSHGNLLNKIDFKLLIELIDKNQNKNNTEKLPDYVSDNINYLTMREIELIYLLKEGFTSKQIAEKLNISIRTVEVYRYNIRKKLGIKKNINLVEHLLSIPE